MVECHDCSRKRKKMSDYQKPSRRALLGAGLAGITGAALSPAVPASAAENANEPGEKVRYADMRPDEFRKRLAARPLAYLPLGTLEWHGEHLPYGSDAIQCEGLMIECARRYGGIVLPPLHAGPGPTMLAPDGKLLIGMDFWNKVVDPPRQLDGDCYWIPDGLFISLVDSILEQCRRTGFKAVFADGHGPSRASWVREIPRRGAHYGLKLFGVTADIQGAWKSQIDHAAKNETSLMLHYRPDLVDLSRLPRSRSEKPLGVWGDDPRDATAGHGRECMESAIGLMIGKFRAAGM